MNKHNVGGTRPPPFPLPKKYKYNMFDTTRVGCSKAGTMQKKEPPRLNLLFDLACKSKPYFGGKDVRDNRSYRTLLEDK